MAVTPGEPITYAYVGRGVHATVGRQEQAWSHDGVLWHYFMPRPVSSETATPVSQMESYEGITWERGWTDGVALLAAHALAISR